jgi:hypothetical protein
MEHLATLTTTTVAEHKELLPYWPKLPLAPIHEWFEAIHILNIDEKQSVAHTLFGSLPS